jgi:hypothetical protein
MDDEDLKPRLFEMPKQRKRENWLCIILIAPETVSNNKKYAGKDAVGAYLSLLSSRKSDIHLTRPSFLGMRKVGDNHSEAPHCQRTPSSQRRLSSSMNTCWWCLGTGYGRHVYGGAPSFTSKCILRCG